MTLKSEEFVKWPWVEARIGPARSCGRRERLVFFKTVLRVMISQ